MMSPGSERPPAAVNTVELANVRKNYDDFAAVDNLSLRIQPGRIYGLLGPNGAGKTSTLRMIIGIIVPDSGRISIFGEPLQRAHMDRVGYLPEERGLYRKMKVLDSPRASCSTQGVDERRSIKARSLLVRAS